jgi:hypothetical protein
MGEFAIGDRWPNDRKDLTALVRKSQSLILNVSAKSRWLWWTEQLTMSGNKRTETTSKQHYQDDRT